MSQLDSRVGTMDFVGKKAVRTRTAKGEDRVEIVTDLAGYLAKLGLADGELDQMITMLQTGRQEDARDEISMEGAMVLQEPASRLKGSVGSFLAEEQQILREAYQSVFIAQSNIKLLGSTADTSTDFLAGMLQALKPDVIILGVKAVDPCTVEKLEVLREACPQMGLVLLLAMYDGQGIKALREFSRDASAVCAYLLKHTIDTVEQQVLRGTYEAYFGTHDAIKLLGSASDVSGDSLIKDAEASKPDLVLLGVKVLRPAMLESIHELREDYEDVGLVLLASSYDDGAFKSLRSMPIGRPLGTAYLYKHTMDTLDHVARVVKLVAEGRTIAFPKVMAGLIDAEQTVGATPKLISAMDTCALDSPAWLVRPGKVKWLAPLERPKEACQMLAPLLRKEGSVSTGRCLKL